MSAKAESRTEAQRRVADEVRDAVNALNAKLVEASHVYLRVDLSVQDYLFRSQGEPEAPQLEVDVYVAL